MIEKSLKRKSRIFCAVKKEDIIGFIEVSPFGENFISFTENMLNICGGYLKPEYRGSGIYFGLLQYLLKVLKNEGFTRLGVDFESFNPPARGFWLKYFTQYTYSVMRSIYSTPH